MNTSSPTLVASRTLVQKFRHARRRSILSGALLPVVLSGPAFAADLVIGPDRTINSDAGVQLYGDGLREGLINAYNDTTTVNPVNGPDNGQGAGVSLGLRMGQSTAFGPAGWGDNRTWIYTGEMFTGPNGIISIAAQNDDTDWFRIDNVVRLADTVWDSTNAFSVGGLTPNTWVQFEYRVSNGGGGAGPSAQNINGAVNWNNTTGVVFSYVDEALSLDANVYDGGRPTEAAGGGPTLFRFQNGFGLSDDLNVATSGVLTIDGNNTAINETSLRFTNTAAATLTINDGAASPHKTLGILGQTQWATLASGGSDVILDGTTDLRPLGVQTDNGNEVRVTRNGAGKLILDTPNAGSNLTSTTFVAGTGTIEVLSASGSSPIPSAKLELANAAGIIRIGSTGASAASFANDITATVGGTILHNTPNADTLSNVVRLSANANLTFNVTNGGLVAAAGITSGNNSRIIKSGTGLLRSTAPVTARNITMNDGRFELLGTLSLTNNPVLNGGVLAISNTSGLNTMPAAGLVISGAGILEGRAGSFGASTNTIQITSNGTLRLGENLPRNGVFLPGVPTGLYGFFYGGDDAAANQNFSVGSGAAMYTNYATYFDRRTGLESSALTSANNTGLLSYDPAGGDTAMFSMYGQNRTNNIVSRMVGKINITTAGTYTFGTTSDDGSMLFIDGLPVVNNNFYQGMTRRTGTVDLSAGYHDIDIGFYEGGGGNGLVVDWAGPGFAQQTLPNSVLAPAAHEVLQNPVTISGAGNIQVTALTGRFSGAFTFEAGGTLGSSGYNMTVDNITLPAAGTYTFSPTNEVTLSQITDNAAAVAIVKTGTGVLTIDNVAGPQLTNAGSTIAVNQGALGILLGGASNPTGAAAITFNGGGVVLSSKNGDQSYTIPNFTGDAILQARKLASGLAGTPLLPIVITLNGNLNLPAGRKLTLGTADNYIEVLGGSASGSGTVGIAGGTVNTSTNTAVQGLKVNFNAGASILNMLTNAPTVGGIGNDFGASGTINIGDGAAGAAVLTINGSDTASFTGTINQNLNSTFSVVKSGTGRQSLTGPSQATAYTVNSGTLELSNASLNAATTPVDLAGGTLEFANPGLILKIYDSDPGAVVGGVPGAYSGILNTLPGVFQRYNAMGTPLLATTTASNGNLLINYNPSGSDTAAPFAIHGHADLDTVEAIFTGLLEVPVGMAGNWTFDPRSDDGTMIYIDGVLVSNNNFPQGIGHVPRPGTINLTEGRHEIVMTFNEGVGGAGMYVNFTPPGGTNSLLPNTLLFNRDITAQNPINVTGSSTINAGKGTVVLGNLTQATAATLSVVGGGSVSFPQTVTTGGTALNFSVGVDTVVRPGNVAGTTALTATGNGTVLLDFNGPQFATGTVNANGGTVAVAQTQGGVNPLGSATVNLTNGGILGLSTAVPASDFTYSNPIVVGTGGGGIRAGRFNSGPAGLVFTQTYDQPISVTNSAPLSFSSADGYTLALTGTIGSNGQVAVTGGNVTTTATVAGASLAVTGGRLDSFQALNFTSGGTVAGGGTLRFNGNAYTGGTLNVSGTLEFNGTRTGNVPSTYDGGTVKVTSGIIDFSGGPVTGSVPSATTVPGTLTAKSFTFTNPAGGFGTDQSIAFTLAATPLFNKPLTNADVNFGPVSAADPVFNTFFGGNTGDAFTATLTGSFTSPANGPITFGHSILDDNGSIWVDVNQNGVFERNGSAGDEQITRGGCCGPAPADNTVNGVVNLVSGQKYNVAFVLEDTGGGSSFAAKWDIGGNFGPNGGLTKFVNAGDPTQAGIWSTTTATAGGAKLDIAATSELRVGAVTNITDANLGGADSKLVINGGSSSNSSIEVLRNSAGTSTVDVATGNTLTVAHLTVAPGTTITKTGAGTITTSGLSIGGNGGFLAIDAGTVINTTPAIVGVANYASGGVNVNGTGTFQLQGSLSGAVTVTATGTLRGSGTLGTLMVEGTGIVAPGVGPTTGTLNVNGGMNMLSGTVLALDMTTSLASDKLNVVGNVFLGGATLGIAAGPGFTWAPFEVFPLVLNDLDDLVSGTFNGLPEGALLTINGVPFNISYAMSLDGGVVGNDVGITAVPEPGSAVFLLGGFALLIGAQRKRNHRHN